MTMECPICMDDIQACNVNCVTTECGHQFHTSCLMRNVAHNGFGCPYCRNVMADEVEDSDDDEYTEIDDDEETIISDVPYDPQSPDNDRALSGMRQLFRRAQNDIEDAADEGDDDEDNDDDDLIKLTSQQIADTLLRANFTMADIVKAYTIVTGYYQNGQDETDDQVNEFMEKIDDHMDKLLTGDIPPVLSITISLKEEKLEKPEIAESKSSTKPRLNEVEECL